MSSLSSRTWVFVRDVAYRTSCVVFAPREKLDDDRPDEELQKKKTVLPICSACLSKGAKINAWHAIRNSSQRASRAAIQDKWKAKRDAWTAAAEVHPSQEDMKEGIAPEALEVPMRRWR